MRYPFRTALRLIPLHLKERINRMARQPIFDLSFYLQFQPASLEYVGVQLRRMGGLPHGLPPLGERRRIAFITPHLGPGGAENVLLDMAQSLDRNLTEIFLIATHSKDSRCAPSWHEHADHVYDLATTLEPEDLPSALYSLILNWQMDTVVVQNTLIGYSVIPQCKRELPGLKVVDVIHTVGTQWDIAAATVSVAGDIDTRIVISEAAKKHLIALGTTEEKIRLIQNGVDLYRFQPGSKVDSGVFRILFAARLDPVKRPLLLVDIAHELSRRQPSTEFQFIVAGDGPEERALRRRVHAAGMDHLFDIRGYVEDLAPLLAESDMLVVTSSNEGIPLTILEAFASAKPVVASRAGAIEEILDDNRGVLVDRNGDEAVHFADAIRTLMTDPDLRYRMGLRARRHAEPRHDRCQALPLYRAALTPVRDDE